MVLAFVSCRKTNVRNGQSFKSVIKLWSISDISYGRNVSSLISFGSSNPTVRAPRAYWNLEVPHWVWALASTKTSLNALASSFQILPSSGNILRIQPEFPLNTGTILSVSAAFSTPLQDATFIPPSNVPSHPNLTHPSKSSSTSSSFKKSPMAIPALLIFLFLLKYNLTCFVCITIYHPFFPL